MLLSQLYLNRQHNKRGVDRLGAWRRLSYVQARLACTQKSVEPATPPIQLPTSHFLLTNKDFLIVMSKIMGTIQEPKDKLAYLGDYDLFRITLAARANYPDTEQVINLLC